MYREDSLHSGEAQRVTVTRCSVMEQVLNDLQSYLYVLMYAPFYDIYHLGHHL